MSSKGLLVQTSYAASADLNAAARCQENEESISLKGKSTGQRGNFSSTAQGFSALRAMLFMMLAAFIFVAFPGKMVTVIAASKGPYTVTEDTTIDAAVFSRDDLYTEVRIKNGAKVTVEGNVLSKIPVIIENEGKLTVSGNYIQQANGFEPVGIDAEVQIDGDFSVVNSGVIWNNDETITVSIGGNFLYNSTSSTQLNAAKWKIKGNVTHSTDKNGGVYFNKLYLIGDSEQTLCVKSGTGINALYMENSNKLKVPANLNAVICSNVDITAGADTVINKMTISEGKKVNFEGDFTAEGDVKVNNRAELRVTGDYLQKNGVFEPVGTDVIAEIDGSFSVINSGAIWNNDVTTTVSISGDFLYNSTSGTQLNAATWKVKGDVTQGTKNGRCYIGTLELLTKGATLDIDNGRISTLVIDCGISNFDIPKVCYDKVRATVKGTFDANGGVLSDRSTLITSGDKFGQLPTPTLNGKDFDGWFTEKNGGDKITKDTVSEFIDDFTIYAHWTDKEVEDPGQQEQDPIDTGVAIKVTRVSLDYTSVELEVGDEYQLTASVMPKNATNKEVQWSSNVASIATVSDTGLVTAVSEGSATITVKTVDGRKTATCLVRVTRPVVAPAKVKLSSVKNSKAKTTTVKWNKLNGVDGYEIEYALNKKFTKTRKTKDVNSGSAKSATIKKLKKGKTYYFRIRAYAFDSHGQKVYGDWCAAKKVKIKK